MKTSTYAPFAKPLYVMVKPVGAVCNLACDYCYYLEKANLYKDNPKHVMSDELLEKFIDEYINSQTMPQVLFTWHGGETLMRPLSFYKKAMELQKKYARGRTIDNCIQTNGTMLTDEWCEFFRENNWLVGNFLCALFDEWVKEDVGKYYIQIFDSTLANWVGEQPGICTMAKTCGHAGVMEFNGDVYSCDHFVFPEYKLGNIDSQTLVEMMHSERQHKFGNMKYQSLPTQCKECDFLFACNGECPKNRFSQTADGEPGLNYLCKGYYQFFQHVAPYMDYMKNELMNQRPPANIMEALKNGELEIED